LACSLGRSGTSGSFALATSTQNATVNNSGTVNGSVQDFASAGGNTSGTNSGTISQFLQVDTNGGGNASATNSGTVGTFMQVFTNGGGNASATNSGPVGQALQVFTEAGGNASATNSGAVGTFLQVFTNGGGNASVTNSGPVGQYLQVFTNAGGNASATNSGTVGQAFTVDTLAGGNASATNSGSVFGGAVITALGGGNSSLTNSGLITNTMGGPAIQFVGGPDTLTNVVGSRVIGAIDLVGVHDTVNFVGGGNWLYTFNTLAGATINTNGAPFVVSGNQVAVLDQSAFALADRSLMFFTGGVSQMLRDRLYGTTPAAGGSTAMSFAPTGSGVVEQAQAAFGGIPSVAMAYASDPRPILGKAPAAVPYYDTTVWASGFGGQRDQGPTGAVLQATDTAYGAAAGIDRVFASNVRLGAFIGGGSGQEAVALNTQTIDTTYFYGGMYGQVDKGAQFLDFALWGGSMNNSSTRGVANNLVPTGFDLATASYGGWFISPELIYGMHIPMNDVVWTPRATVRYVGGVLDGYSETGSAQNLTVSQRAINDIEERVEVELSNVTPISFGGTVKTFGTAGVIGLERLGNPNINTVLLGQNLSFVTPGVNDAIGAVLGAGLQYRPTASVSLYVNAEGTVMSDKSVSGAVTGGARVAF
jgi:hypothetical protein